MPVATFFLLAAAALDDSLLVDLKQQLDAQAQELRTLKTTVASLQGEIAALRSADEAPPQQVATSSAGSARVVARPRGRALQEHGRRLSSAGAYCAGENELCACDGDIYFGTKHTTASDTSSAVNTFAQVTALTYVEPLTGSTSSGYTIAPNWPLRGIDAPTNGTVCSSATLGVADPAEFIVKACYCKAYTVHCCRWSADGACGTVRQPPPPFHSESPPPPPTPQLHARRAPS